MALPLILYSTNTWLAYAICQRYYGGMHYIWCTPFLGPNSLASYDVTVPPSASPLEIYLALSAEVRRGERHSTRIEQNRAGLLRGAKAKQQLGVIDTESEAEIGAIVQQADTRDFRPLLYIVPYAIVSNLVRKVPVERRAHPLSDEYIAEELPRRYFDVIELPI